MCLHPELIKPWCISALCVGVVAFHAHAAPQVWQVASPNQQLQFTLRETAAPSGPSLQFRFEAGSPGRREVILRDSPLGLRLETSDLHQSLSFDSATPEETVAETYTLVHGKRQQCANRARTRSFTFRNPAGEKVTLQVRVFNDGLAFRYHLPARSGDRLVLSEERTGFALPEEARIWCAPSDKATMYSPAYETYYVSGLPANAASSTGLGWSFPMLFHSGTGQLWGLITEAGLDATFCGSRLSSQPTNGYYQVVLPIPAEGNGQGSIHPASTAPWTTPWRVLIVGSLATIVESTLVTDVSPPSKVSNTAWIKPGRVAWSWWSDNDSPKDGGKQKKFIDLAADMGWEYVLVDANWNIMDNGNIHDVLRYAKSKDVGILLWYNSGGAHNLVTEKPRDSFTFPNLREFEFKLLNQWGVKGVKVDFFQSDKQDVIALYEGLMRDAAAKQIMVNFHGCTLPRGWERTYPHLMSMEAVRGEECYIFDDKYPEAAPVQNTILPFTRNVVGPMDYTPVGFSDNRYPHKTTAAHELALAVLFTSGWLHFTDSVESYRAAPDEVKAFLREVPVTWDEVRFLDGHPGQFALIARRKGTSWYLAGVNGVAEPRSISLRLSAFGIKAESARVIMDGAGPRSFSFRNEKLNPGTDLKVQMGGFGGFTAILH